MNCIDTDTALTVVQSLGDDADRRLTHLATCPACAATLTDVALLNQSFQAGEEPSEETVRYIYESIRSAPQDVDEQLSEEPVSPRPLLAGATFLVALLTMYGVTLYPGMNSLFYLPVGYAHVFWLRVLMIVAIATFVTWPELLRPLTRARIWRHQLQSR